MIATALIEMFGSTHPIVLGSMEGVAGGRLATAVSNVRWDGREHAVAEVLETERRAYLVKAFLSKG